MVRPKKQPSELQTEKVLVYVTPQTKEALRTAVKGLVSSESKIADIAIKQWLNAQEGRFSMQQYGQHSHGADFTSSLRGADVLFEEISSSDRTVRKLKDLSRSMTSLCASIRNDEDDWDRRYDKNDPNSMYTRFMLNHIEDKLSDTLNLIQSLTSPVIDQGTLVKNSTGRYELNGREFTSGSSIEFLYDDDFSEVTRWVNSRVESKKGEYFIVGYPHVQLDGLIVRRKG